MACLSNLSVTVGHSNILWSKFGLTTYKRKVYGDKNVSKLLFLQLNSLRDYSLHESSEVVILVSRLVSNKSLALVLISQLWLASTTSDRFTVDFSHLVSNYYLKIATQDRFSELGNGNHFSARLNFADIKNKCNKIVSLFSLQISLTGQIVTVRFTISIFFCIHLEIACSKNNK